MADYSDRKTEAELINLEKKLNRLYRRAWNEMRLETEEYFEQFSERYQREYEKYKAGQYTEQQFKAWYQAQVARGKTWEAKRDTLAMQMTHTNEIAAAYVNGTTPSIYALNANYAAYMTEQKYDVSFTLVNEEVIQNLVTEKSNAIAFKTMSVNPVRDYKWNSKQIQSALISGILQGQSIDKLADAFMVVQKRNRNAAVRNARTSVTSAQNAGRIDTMKRSQAMGIDIKKEWLSAHDGRVRDSHAVLNGQIRNIDEAFDNGLMYPADPEGAPSEVYNCRCTLKYVYPKYMSKKSNELYSETKQDNETYQEWLQRKSEANNETKIKTRTANYITNCTQIALEREDYSYISGTFIADDVKKQITELAKKLNMSDEEVLKAYESGMNKIVKNCDFGIRIQDTTLEKVLEDGYFKNQFETISSTGIYNPTIRINEEYTAFNVPKDIDALDRPIYGMMFPKYNHDNSDVKEYYLNGAGAWYGNTTVIFKKKQVIANTTLTLGDSLNSCYNLVGTEALNPTFAGANVNSSPEAIIEYALKGGNADKALMDATTDSLSSYIECQYHGKETHTIDNIKKVIINQSDNSEILQNKLKVLGIPFEVINN